MGVAAHGMARGSGVPKPVTARSSDAEISSSQDLMEPISELDALLFIFNALLREVAASLASQGKAAIRLGLRFRLEGGGEQELGIRLGEPTRDPRRLLALLRTRLERFQLAGAVTGLSVEVPEPVPFTGRQRGLLDWHAVGETLSDVMARLQDQLGEGSVRSARLVSQHRPEAEWRAIPFRAAATSSSRQSAAVAQLQDDPVYALEGHPEQPLPERPAILLPLPLAIEVDAAPGLLPRAIQLDGRWAPVNRWDGHELLTGDWWDRPYQREYWRAHLNDGRCAWVYREDGRWALHGWWDR